MPNRPIEDVTDHVATREKRRRRAGKVECPKCGKQITLWMETDEWTLTRTGKWKHSQYGPAVGDCGPCELAFLDYWEGCKVFDLKERAR